MSHDYIIITIKYNIYVYAFYSIHEYQTQAEREIWDWTSMSSSMKFEQFEVQCRKIARSTYSYKDIRSLIWGCTLTSFVSCNICGLWQVWTVEEAKKQAQRECCWLQCGSCHAWMGLSMFVWKWVGECWIHSHSQWVVWTLFKSAPFCVFPHGPIPKMVQNCPPSSWTSNFRACAWNCSDKPL